MTNSIFFDLDGTLTDSRQGITACIQHAMTSMGHVAPSQEDLLWCIGPSLLGSFGKLIGEENAATGLALYRERFAEIGWKENIPYHGIDQVLSTLHEAGHRLFVATSKPHVYANKIVEHFGMGTYISKVYGSELDGTRHDKPELLQFALNDSDSVAGSIMIGDRQFDAHGAFANSMHFVGVTYGFGSKQELAGAGATRLANRPVDLLANLSELTGKSY